jgi:hypothetical protein
MRIKEKLLTLLRHTWPSLLLTGGLIWLLIYSVQEASWVRNNDTFTIFILLGVVFGALLSISHFSGRFILVYSLFISLAVVSQVVGNVLISPMVMSSMPVLDIFWVMNVRLATLMERMAGWIVAAINGGNIQDTGLFIFLIGLIAWNACAWLAWCIIRRRSALEGLLPFGFLLAINVYLSGQSISGFLGFIILAVLLSTRTSLTRHNHAWEKRKVDYPDELGLEWGLSGAAIALIVFVIALAFQQLGTHEGREQISELYRSMIERSEKTAERLFTEVSPARAFEATPQAAAPRLELIGPPLDQGQETIMYVQISDPAPPPLDPYIPVQINIKRHYWRDSVYITYTGAGWTVGTPREERLQELPAEPPPGSYSLTQSYTISAMHSSEVFAVNNPVSLGPEGVKIFYSGPDDSALVRGPASHYTVVSWAADPTIAQLQSAGEEYPAQISATYLQLPESLPRRVREMARRIVSDAPTPYEKARRIESYLRLTYPYKLDTPPPSPGHDAVDYFLFEAPGGFCTYYASAMTVMLRAEGVPARIVTGYAMGYFDYTENAYRVPRSSAHAWVEVYFPHFGWVEFEPTAALDTFNRTEGEMIVPTPTATPPEDLPSGITLGGVIFVSLLVLLVIIALALMWFSGRKRKPQVYTREKDDSRPAVLYRHVRRALGWAGLSASPNTTPDEFLSACAAPLTPHSQVWAALLAATNLYRQSAFSPRPPGSEAVHSARRSWQMAQLQWLGLFAGHLYRSMRTKKKK